MVHNEHERSYFECFERNRSIIYFGRVLFFNPLGGSVSTDFVCAGQLCLDIFPRFENQPGCTVGELLRPGSVVRVSEMSFSVGGCVANTAGALARFGIAVKAVGRVGDDILGTMLADLLKARLDTSGLVVAEGQQGSYTLNLSPVGIDRIFLYSPGPNQLFDSTDVSRELLENTKLVHLGYPTYMDRLHEDNGRELVAIFDAARQSGATTSMDTSLADPG
ncbi:MAG: hypothetical protein GF418_11130, partial [Chitinivibrionales bacterium]|nr:hypothetical protein [Chitinivibrionales bacterium]MBD3396168.1 hypothetical protein [Chitinivibrionales bacterium]